MRLTQFLLGVQGLPRRMFSGKHRIPRRVSVKNKGRLLFRLAREEENLFYLRMPYLTEEQEDRYITNYELPREAAQEYVTRRTIFPSVSSSERLQHLMIAAKWD